MLNDANRFRLRGNRVAWAFVPYLALCQALQLAFPVPGLHWVTFEFFALVLIVIVTSPWWMARWRDLGKPVLLVAGAFLALVVYGLVTLPFHGPAQITTPDGGPVPMHYLLMPLLDAALATVAGLGIILCAEPRQRLRVLTAAGAASVLVAFVGWPFQSAYRGYIRLATGQGGAAIIHVMFLLIVALGLASYLRGSRKWLSLAVVVAGMGAVLATQSRGALINVAAWVALLLLGRLITNPNDLKRVWPLGAGLALAAVALPLIPGMDRLFSLYDPKRATNLDTALELWSSGPLSVIFGTGSGQVWPWSGYESGLYPMPGGDYAGYRPTEAGNVLLTPHSTPLTFLVEFGLPGVVAAAAMGLGLLAMWWKSRVYLPRLVLASATLACLVAFLVDTYLLRNFGISLWWWACLAVVATCPKPTPDELHQQENPPSLW